MVLIQLIQYALKENLFLQGQEERIYSYRDKSKICVWGGMIELPILVGLY